MFDHICTLHHSTLVLDSHIDIPWPDRKDAEGGSQRRRFDIPKMQRGRMGAACLAAYLPQGPLDDLHHRKAYERAIAMLDVIQQYGAIKGVRVCSSSEAVISAHARGECAIVPAVENGYAIGNDLDSLHVLRGRGVRYVTLTHNGHNLLGDSAKARQDLGDQPLRYGGLSDFGREAIRVMNQLGILVDVSHAARDTMMQAAALSDTPIVATHSCVRALCDHSRNLDDEQLDVIKDVDGVIQITAMSPFLKRGANEKNPATVADLVDHVEYVARRIGVRHVGLSSDFDGGGGIKGWMGSHESMNVTHALVQRGFSAQEVAAIWGGNFLRLMKKAEDIAVQTEK